MKAFFLFLGLVLGSWSSHSHSWPILGCAWTISAIMFVVSLKKKEALIFSCGLVIGVGCGLFSIPFADGQATFRGFVIQAKQNYILLWRPFQRIYVPCVNNTYQFGDLLEVQGKIQPIKITTYESRFNFKDYLWNLGVSKELSLKQAKTIVAFPYRFRTAERNFLSHFSENSQSLLSCLLFGINDTSAYGVSLLDSMNLLSLCSSSGVIFSALYRFNQKWARRLFAEDKKGDLLVWTISLLFLPSGLRKVGILRCILQRGFCYFDSYYAKKRRSSYERTSLVGLALLLINRYYAYQKGFLIGFGLSFLLQLVSLNWAHQTPFRKKIFSFLALRYFLVPFSASEGTWHLMGGLFNLAVTPYLFLLCGIGYFSFLSLPFPVILNPLCDGFTHYLSFLKKIDLSLSLPRWSVYFECVFYVLFVLALALREHGIKKPGIALTASFWTFYIISLVPVLPCLEESVTFINVGQGDSILLVSHGETAMIDTGGSLQFDLAEECLIPYLKKRRIYKIDYLIASHHDFDHVGASDSLRSHYSVGQWIDGPDSFPLKTRYWTFRNLNVYGGVEENETSLFLYCEFMGKKWLFTGDAPTGIERQVLRDHPDLRCDILKVGHHGSDTSTSDALLAQIQCKEAVISCGENNKYGHPKPEVLERLQAYGVRVRRTDQEGTIRYVRWSLG